MKTVKNMPELKVMVSSVDPMTVVTVKCLFKMVLVKTVRITKENRV